MLKIKDNIDLKELEKFGFNYKEIECIEEIYCMYEIKDKSSLIQIDCKTKGLYYICSNGTENNITMNAIYNLIKADLVEKVD